MYDWLSRLRRRWRIRSRGPEAGGAAGGRLAGTAERAERHELREGSVNASAADTAVKEAVDLGFGESLGSSIDGLFDAVGDVVPGAGAEEEGSARRAVIPYGERRLKMRQPYDGAAIEGSVDGAETQDLGFGATGGGAVKAGTRLAQDGVAIVPQLARGVVATEEDFLLGGGPVEGAAELAGDAGELFGAQAAAFGEADAV